jgi:hypothetical protein
MGYYQGDFYAGAMGDPGFLSFIGRGVKAVGGLIGRATGLVSPRAVAAGSPSAAGAASSMIKAGGTAIIKRVGGAIVKHPVLSAAGAAGAVGIAGTAAVEHMMSAGVAPKGYHMSKPKGGRCPSSPHLVRNRRMNVANGRALSRAVRRLHHFARKYRKVVGFVSPKRPKGRMYFRKKSAKR